MSSFASGKHALQICDRCGRRVKYGQTTNQIINQTRSGLWVCDECLDEDHPQLQVGRIRVNDPQGLENPRSESYSISRGFFGWRPVTSVAFTPEVCGARVGKNELL